MKIIFLHLLRIMFFIFKFILGFFIFFSKIFSYDEKRMKEEEYQEDERRKRMKVGKYDEKDNYFKS